jgi:hypothetical protein
MINTKKINPIIEKNLQNERMYSEKQLVVSNTFGYIIPYKLLYKRI